MWRSGASGLGVPGAGKTWNLTRARRANAVIAAPPSQHSSAGRVMTCRSAAASSRGRTASMVAPVRSRATMMGICSADRPRLAALPPRLRDALGRSQRLPLKDSRMKVSSASTIPDRHGGLSRLSADRNRCLHRNAVVYGHLAAFRGLRDRLAGDQRLRLVRPAILVMQAGQRRPGQRVECLPAARAAVPRLAASLAPGTNVIPTAVRTAKARNPTPPDLRQQVFLR